MGSAREPCRDRLVGGGSGLEGTSLTLKRYRQRLVRMTEWRTQSAANQSPRPEFLLTGKNTGNLFDLGASGRMGPTYRRNLGHLQANSLLTITGIFLTKNRESNRGSREYSQGRTGNGGEGSLTTHSRASTSAYGRSTVLTIPGLGCFVCIASLKLSSA